MPLSTCVLQHRHTQTHTHTRCPNCSSSGGGVCSPWHTCSYLTERKVTKLQQSYVSRGKPSALVLFSPHWGPFAHTYPISSLTAWQLERRLRVRASASHGAGSKSLFLHILAMSPWASCLTSLSLNFPFSKYNTTTLVGLLCGLNKKKAL